MCQTESKRKQKIGRSREESEREGERQREERRGEERERETLCISQVSWPSLALGNSVSSSQYGWDEITFTLLHSVCTLFWRHEPRSSGFKASCFAYWVISKASVKPCKYGTKQYISTRLSTTFIIENISTDIRNILNIFFSWKFHNIFNILNLFIQFTSKYHTPSSPSSSSWKCYPYSSLLFYFEKGYHPWHHLAPPPFSCTSSHWGLGKFSPTATRKVTPVRGMGYTGTWATHSVKAPAPVAGRPAWRWNCSYATCMQGAQVEPMLIVSLVVQSLGALKGTGSLTLLFFLWSACPLWVPHSFSSTLPQVSQSSL